MENKILNQEIEITNLFEVEELEERVEFDGWGGSASGGSNGIDHAEIHYTITF